MASRRLRARSTGEKQHCRRYHCGAARNRMPCSALPLAGSLRVASSTASERMAGARSLARFAHHRTSGRPLESSGGGAVGFAAPDAVSGRPGTPESGAMEAGAPDSGLGSRWMAGAGQTPPAAPVAARAAGGGRTAAGGVSRERRGPAARAGRRARARTAPAAGSRTGTRPGSCGR